MCVYDCSCRYTADAGIGNPPKEEQGGACHNDLPINGADIVFAAMIRDPATAKDEMMIVNGDISYARGWPWIWERYFDLIQPLATMMPWMVYKCTCFAALCVLPEYALFSGRRWKS